MIGIFGGRPGADCGFGVGVVGVVGAVPVGGDHPEKGPPSDHLKISPHLDDTLTRLCDRIIRGQVEGDL